MDHCALKETHLHEFDKMQTQIPLVQTAQEREIQQLLLHESRKNTTTFVLSGFGSNVTKNRIEQLLQL